MGAMGAMQQGKAQQAMMNAEARAAEVKAGQERASAQRLAENERQKKEAMLSEINASAAASGGGVVGSVIDVMGKTAMRGKLNEQTAMYEGEERGRGLEGEAARKRFAGKQAAKAGKMEAFTGILKGISGFASSDFAQGSGGNSGGHYYGGWDTSVRYG